MKVICPECSADFNVPTDVLGRNGKRVRCSQCSHIWFQEPVVEEDVAPKFGGFRGFDEVLPVEPIPPSVHPDTDMDMVVSRPALADDDDEEENGKSFLASLNYRYLAQMVGGFAVSAAIVLGVWINLMPKADAGVSSIKVADVKVVAAKKDEHDVTNVTGRIVNASSEETVVVPTLEITPVDINGTELEGVRIKPEQESLKPEEVVEFGAQLEGAPPEGGNIRVRIVR